MNEQSISLTVNGTEQNAKAEPRMSLADFLRERLGLTGTHIGCEHGVCGACTVICDGMAVRSCLMFAVQAEKKEIKTIEGLADGDTMHPLQTLFSEQRALQCGFCTPGMLMTAVDLVDNNPSITPPEIKTGMSAVLCRCTGYEGILKAVEAYAMQIKGV
ncbi:MAG TPA: (2Fe-2S)-binding protein [Rhodospirillales bacterium]|jgi:carbon-monoxide dehydrogenase small subunit|nr:(2Fe-2S)-binding protein [Rhodospirillales bacterium]HIB21020.1 (2Fe-2S)-binding protein [Rhodospirillales bacterium]HIC59279.1 (2Fe-2S)-binding protein [Rhodospirillales bacterium]HIP10632.1 (2Fe-2S)-binding protein [Rhodospirillales bacterium]